MSPTARIPRLGLLLGLLLPLPGYALDLETLAAALAERGAGSTSYQQTRYLDVLDEPLESSGELIFQPPDLLIQDQRRPEPQRLVLTGDRLVLEADGRRRMMELDESPRGAALAASLRGLLNGRIDRLREDYELMLDERADGEWRLTLLPLDDRLTERIRRIRVVGRLDDGMAEVRKLTMEFANGDRSVMRMRSSAERSDDEGDS